MSGNQQVDENKRPTRASSSRSNVRPKTKLREGQRRVENVTTKNKSKTAVGQSDSRKLFGSVTGEKTLEPVGLKHDCRRSSGQHLKRTRPKSSITHSDFIQNGDDATKKVRVGYTRNKVPTLKGKSRPKIGKMSDNKECPDGSPSKLVNIKDSGQALEISLEDGNKLFTVEPNSNKTENLQPGIKTNEHVQNEMSGFLPEFKSEDERKLSVINNDEKNNSNIPASITDISDSLSNFIESQNANITDLVKIDDKLKATIGDNIHEDIDKSVLPMVESTSSMYTDSSDIEVLNERKCSSDSIEILGIESEIKKDMIKNLFGDESVSPLIDIDNLLSKGDKNLITFDQDSQKIDSYTKRDSSSDVVSHSSQEYDENLQTPQIEDQTLIEDLENTRVMKPNDDLMPLLATNLDLLAIGACSSARSVPVSAYDRMQYDAEFITSGGHIRPDTLSLPKPLQYYEKKRLSKRESESSLSSYSTGSSTDALIEMASNTPLNAQGTVTVEGDMIAFVAQSLNEMIKMSSPLSKKGDSSGASWSGNQTPSAKSVSSVSSSASGWSISASSTSGVSYSGLSSRSPSVLTQSPDDIPPVDPRALMDLEVHARKVAASLDHMMATLKDNLHKMSAVTCDSLNIYKDSIDHTCDSVDASIKSMYTLMARCEELTKNMKPIYQLAEQVKEIKRLLDMFEGQVSKQEV